MLTIELSEERLCEIIGVCIQTLSYYLDGHKFTHIKRIKKPYINPTTGKTKYAKYFKVTKQDLLDLAEHKSKRRRNHGVCSRIY